MPLAELAARLDSEPAADVLADLALDDAVAAAADGLAGTGGGGAEATLATGLGASPGAAVGAVYLSVDSALDALDRGEAVILALDETTPSDEPVMRLAEGILTTRGGLASHAAVVARGLGIPAVCGAADVVLDGAVLVASGRTVREGEVISLDGATGEVSIGERRRRDVSAAEAEALERLVGASDALRADGGPAVLANADTAADAARAIAAGAEGIGLCRTEHMFGGDRLELLRRFILAEGERDEAGALAALAEVQQADFEGLLAVCDGSAVTVRLLDPPLHEFLPPEDDSLSEVNPMLGTRGVRLALVRPGLYEMQVAALARAVRHQLEQGGRPRVRILVPLVSTTGELVLARRRISAVLAAELDSPAEVAVGAMIETPRAALVASALAADADFFSVGTNDLTQLVWGFSRDDVERLLLRRYQEEAVLEHSPFAHLDPVVADLVARTVADGTRARPGLHVGVCGEHAGDPRSIEALVRAGVDSLSCSPPRVRLARLAVGRALARRALGRGEGA